ncbi:hypothetical protein [Burkholderia anthina]|uniref:Uncharacterized protein n=1 Tax=Burkholderia anthina TaxID=179879 RepID=A0A6P2GIJ5_9BURK|nr:hypothetical protein [Burkholderia anthina]VVU52935.1 hypothetical protein BAN20980_05674 [Burkholderia anthina]
MASHDGKTSGRRTNTLRVTGALSCANAVGMLNSAAVTVAALDTMMRMSEPVSRAGGWVGGSLGVPSNAHPVGDRRVVDGGGKK